MDELCFKKVYTYLNLAKKKYLKGNEIYLTSREYHKYTDWGRNMTTKMPHASFKTHKYSHCGKEFKKKNAV